MPYINVKLLAPVTKDQKRELVKQMTNTLVTVLNKKPEHIHIVIDEINPENWGFEGMLTDEWMKK
jgi:4-oxalocrotonate tautomerase